ncbi:hypothetical protein SUGI_0314200 [Cryptomeria japonica]|nr:hypothetical protein SUGI_0314200 [Cryptomeria japonica]
MDRGSAADSRLIRSAKLLRHGPVEGKKVFYWFQIGVGIEKRKKEEPKRLLKVRNWTSDKNYLQEEEVDSGSGVDSRLIRLDSSFPSEREIRHLKK